MLKGSHNHVEDTGVLITRPSVPLILLDSYRYRCRIGTCYYQLVTAAPTHYVAQDPVDLSTLLVNQGRRRH